MRDVDSPCHGREQHLDATESASAAGVTLARTLRMRDTIDLAICNASCGRDPRRKSAAPRILRLAALLQCNHCSSWPSTVSILDPVCELVMSLAYIDPEIFFLLRSSSTPDLFSSCPADASPTSPHPTGSAATSEKPNDGSGLVEAVEPSVRMIRRWPDPGTRRAHHRTRCRWFGYPRLLRTISCCSLYHPRQGVRSARQTNERGDEMVWHPRLYLARKAKTWDTLLWHVGG